MNYNDIVKEKYKIQNKWIETKEDELDIALNLIDELLRLKSIMINNFDRICCEEMPKNVSATEFIVIQNNKIKELEKVFTSRGFTNIEQMATMFDYYKSRIDKAIELIEEILPSMDVKDIDVIKLKDTFWGKDLLEKLKGEENE